MTKSAIEIQIQAIMDQATADILLVMENRPPRRIPLWEPSGLGVVAWEAIQRELKARPQGAESPLLSRMVAAEVFRDYPPPVNDAEVYTRVQRGRRYIKKLLEHKWLVQRGKKIQLATAEERDRQLEPETL